MSSNGGGSAPTILSLNAGTDVTKGSKNPVIQEQSADKYIVPDPQYTPLECAFRAQLIWELCLGRDQRDRYHPELDNMTYVEYYESNRKKDLSYLPPKQNRDDVRVVTGTTREKDTTLLNTMLNLNLESDVTAFDEDDAIVCELGENMSDWVRKSREIEEYDKKRGVIYREMIAQGDVFVQEIYRQDFRQVPISDLHWNPKGGKIADFNIKERLQKIFEGCESRMINGKKVYLGNIREPFIENQQFVAVLNVFPRATAEARYGQWERYKNVPYLLETLTTFYDDGHTYKDWNLITLNDRDKVAEIMVYWKEKNRFMILLNGVMMLPIDFPLTAISPTGDIPIAQGKLEPISDFAYSKSQPSKTKIKQEILDEITRLMVQKARTSYRPPMGNSGKKVYSSSIFNAGMITQDIASGELFPIFGANFTGGITSPDFDFYKAIKAQIDDETSNPQQAGDANPGDQTATETQVLQHNEMLQLTLNIDGLMNLERRMTWNRIYNILTNWTTEVDAHVDDVKQGIFDGFRSFMTNSTVDGRAGHKIFRMTTKQYPSLADHEQEEEDLSKKYGRPVRIVYLNPKMLREIRFKWFIQMTPSPKLDDKLSSLLFSQNLEKAIALFGPESINQEYAKERWAHINRYDFNKFFVKGNMGGMLGPNANIKGIGGQGTAPGAQKPLPTTVSPQNASGAKPMTVGVQ